MHLSASQQQVLATTLDALLPYANERLHIVEADTTDESALDHQLRLELVARALWRNVQLIDDFVASNPSHLAPEQLACARGLKSVLFGDFVYEGKREGRAVLVHETGTYLVSRYDGDPFARLPETPACIRTALVPFAGAIVAVPPLVGLGVPHDTQFGECSPKADGRGAVEPTESGLVLCERIRQWRKELEEHPRETDSSSNSSADAPGPGYHVGPLAGLVGTVRLQAQRDHYDEQARETGLHQLVMESRSVMADVFPMTLEECLEVLDEDSLCSVAEHYDDLPTTPDVSRHKLIDMLCERIVSDRDDRDDALLWCTDQQFDLLRRLMRSNPISLSRISPSEALGYFPMLPYVFMLGEKSSFVAWIPPEVRGLLAEVDLDEVTRTRTRLAQAARAAAALASMSGIVSLDDAYERYRAVASEPLDRTEFEDALVELETCDARDSYALWEYQGVQYVISCELSDDSALARIIRWGYADHIIGGSLDPKTSALHTSASGDIDEEEFDHLLDRELTHLDDMRCRLLACERDLPPHPLDPAMLNQRFVDYLLERSPMTQICDYVDRHLPDGEDDYTFPHTFAQALVISILFERDTYDDVLDVIRLFGMQSCEGPQYPHALGRLITDAFNMLPRWELNGWSLAENTERLTGKRPEPASALLRENHEVA